MEDNVIKINEKQKTSVTSAYALNMEAYDRMKKTTTALASSIAKMTTDASYLAATSVMETLRSQREAIIKNYKTYDFSQSAVAAIKEMNKSINYSILREIKESFDIVGRQLTAIDVTAEMRKNITESIKTMTGSLLSEQIRQLEQIDYSKIFSNIVASSGSIREAVDEAYQAIQVEEAAEETKLETDFSSEEEIQEAINDQINNPVGFQERVSKWTTQKIAKYFIIWQIISFLWANFAQPYFQENIGMPVMSYVVSNVKELPQKGAEVICQLKEDIQAVIIENTNYYYKVSFIDENGVQREGYVAKRNLKLIEEHQK